jgi:DNA-binding GntR family transcriptional regulator
MRRDTPVEHRMLRDVALARDAKKFSELIARHFLTTYENFEKAAKAGLTEASLD